jgi:hypothetical protein
MVALKNLFYAAQHALGVLAMPRDEALRLYCQGSDEACSHEEYCLLETADPSN